MSNHRVLRKKPRISYFEPNDEYSDEYVYCDKCNDYVYEYCSIHGPLLVIPDDKVPRSKPSNVPNAALTIPHEFLHLAKSSIPGAGVGVFATVTLPRGVRFGPYRGRKVTDCGDNFDYCWQIYKENEPFHIITGADASRSNWMRYVNCSRHYQEQNLLAYQYKGEIYYRTIKTIPKHTELLVFYGSECAASLNIDLRKYNNNKYYQEITEATPKTTEMHKTMKRKTSLKINTKPTTTTIEIVADYVPKSEVQAEHIIIDDFKYIDDIANKENVGSDFNIGKDLQLPKTDEDFTDKQDKYRKYELKTTQHLKKGVDHRDKLNFVQKYSYEQEVHFKSEQEKQFLKTDIDFTDENGYVPNFYNKKIAGKLNVDAKFEEKNRNFLKTYADFTDYNHFASNFNDKNENKENNQSYEYKNENKEISQSVEVFSSKNDTDKWFCEICQKTMNKTSKKRHILNSHSDDYKFNCEACSYKTNDEYSLKKHMWSHSRDYKIHCHLCMYVTNSNRNLHSHMKRMHVEQQKSLICEFCDYKCPQFNVMERHKKLHFEENVKKCTKCDYITKCNRNLRAHMLTHLQVNPIVFQCHLCPYRTSLKSIFAFHKNNAHVTS